jgi:competence protein ComGC
MAFYIISKPIYRIEILVEKVNLILVVIVDLILIGKKIIKANITLLRKGNKALIKLNILQIKSYYKI